MVGLTRLVQSGVSLVKRTPWWLRFVVGICFSIALGYLALRALDWGQIHRAFAELSIGHALLGLAAYLASLLFRALRWRVLFVQHEVSLLQLGITQNVGTGVNNMLPVRVLSEPLQMAMLTGRYKVSAPTALATLATEHMLDIVATAMLMGAGVALLPQLRGLSIQLTGSLILGVVSLGAFYFIIRGVPTLPYVGKIPAFERWTEAMATLRHERGRLAGLLSLHRDTLGFLGAERLVHCPRVRAGRQPARIDGNVRRGGALRELSTVGSRGSRHLRVRHHIHAGLFRRSAGRCRAIRLLDARHYLPAAHAGGAAGALGRRLGTDRTSQGCRTFEHSGHHRQRTRLARQRSLARFGFRLQLLPAIGHRKHAHLLPHGGLVRIVDAAGVP